MTATTKIRQIDLHEDGDGVLWFVPEGEGIAIEALANGDFLADCRLYRDSWSPEDDPDAVYPLDRVDLHAPETRRIAIYRAASDEVEILRDRGNQLAAGRHGRRYLRASLEAETKTRIEWANEGASQPLEVWRARDLGVVMVSDGVSRWVADLAEWDRAANEEVSLGEIASWNAEEPITALAYQDICSEVGPLDTADPRVVAICERHGIEPDALTTG